MSESINLLEAANTALGLWRGESKSLRDVGNSDNYVYSFVESGETRYLRITSSRNRSKPQIEAELDFVVYLHHGGVNTALPIPSITGRLIEEIPATESFFACVFSEARGERFCFEPTKGNQRHFRLLGESLGRIHTLSKAYPVSGQHRRFAWDEDRIVSGVSKFLPKSEKIVWREFDALREKLSSYPKSSQTYGLIHGDFGATNYRVRDGQLSIFDFDDCCYHWFVYDLAVAIYPHGWRKEGLQLLDDLLQGYAESVQLSVTIAEITMFCQWRLIYMFLVYAEKWGFEQLTDQQEAWFAQKRENIARGYKLTTSFRI